MISSFVIVISPTPKSSRKRVSIPYTSSLSNSIWADSNCLVAKESLLINYKWSVSTFRLGETSEGMHTFVASINAPINTRSWVPGPYSNTRESFIWSTCASATRIMSMWICDKRRTRETKPLNRLCSMSREGRWMDGEHPKENWTASTMQSTMRSKRRSAGYI